MTITSKEFLRKLLESYVSLSVLILISSNHAAEIEGHSLRNQTALEIPNTTITDRYTRFLQEPIVVNAATTKKDDKKPKTQASGDNLQSSSSEAKRTAKSPLVLRLLQEQEPTDIGNQLVYSPVPEQQLGPEEKSLYFQQTPQEIAAGVPEYAEAEMETLTHKATGPTNPPRYQYVYKVKDPEGNDFGHSEARVDGRTWGNYFVQLPDGRQKTVHYWADATGFHAEVEFKGHAAHPSGEQQ